MTKGAEFEKKVLNFLKSQFEKLGFRVMEAARQQSGTQNGFDIRIRFVDHSKKIREFCFECKEYKRELAWNSMVVKIHEVHASNYLPDGYIAISPHVDFTNINRNSLEKLSRTVGFPIKYWTPLSNVKEYFSLDADFFQYLYGEAPEPNEADKQRIQKNIRDFIKDTLREKDRLTAKTPPVILPKDLTLKIPKIHPDDIVGRTADLQELRTLLCDENRVVVVNGLGGIGKTTLARGYVFGYYKDYKHVVWISQTTSNIAVDITNTEGLLESLSIDKEDKIEERLFGEILRKLKAIGDSPNLLIIDNADRTLTQLKDVLPGPPDWHLLVTSRERVDGFYWKELDFLSLEQAIALFKKHCKLIDEERQIAELINAVDYHTLTIEILAKTAQSRRVDIAALKKSIKDDLQSNVYVEHKGEKIDKVRSYLSSIFNLSRLNEKDTWLMKQFTCLPSEFHNYSALLSLIGPNVTQIEGLAGTLNGLVERGWILYNTVTDAYKMHLIVKEIVVMQLLPALGDIETLMEIGNLSKDQVGDSSSYRAISARPISKATDRPIVREIFRKEFYGPGAKQFPDEGLWEIYEAMETDDLFGAYLVFHKEDLLFLLEVHPPVQMDIALPDPGAIGLYCFFKSEDEPACLRALRSCIRSLFRSPRVSRIVTRVNFPKPSNPRQLILQRSGFVLAPGSTTKSAIYQCFRRTFLFAIEANV
jgi:hypothetical protein